MELRRRNYKNNLYDKIREDKSILLRNEETIKRIKQSQMGVEYINNQINILKSINKEKREKLIILEENVIKVDKGLLDNEIDNIIEKDREIFNKKKRESEKLIEDKRRYKEEKKEISQKYWKNIVNGTRSDKQKERDMKYAWKYYNKVIDTLPSYMKNNLREMTNNKGYIWRGVVFYGEIPIYNEQPRILFEKKGRILVIHEYIGKEYKRFEKEGKNRKILVYSRNK